MMYFFVSTPPKTFFMVKPALAAMSTKLAIWAELLPATLLTGGVFCASEREVQNNTKAPRSRAENDFQMEGWTRTIMARKLHGRCDGAEGQGERSHQRT